VIAWSIGNEEVEQHTTRAGRIAATMVGVVRGLDPTRQITYACNMGNVFRGINPVVDVRGFNYFMDGIEPYHKEHPEQPIVGTETASAYYTRGEYASDAERGYISAYDRNKPGYGATAAEWVRLYMGRDYLAGGFAWTGFDYRGEPSPYRWPCISSHFGIVDTCGFPKDVFYYYRAWWTQQPVLHLLPHWNWAGREGEMIDVWCFTNFPRVQLLLNGKDMGTREIERFVHAEWKVPYEAGVLEAVGFRVGREAQRTRVATTGKPVRLALALEESHAPGGADDVRIVAVSALDDQGQPVPTASNDVALALDGPGRIIGVGNGDPSSHEADRFIPPMFSRPVPGWRFAKLESELDTAPPLAELDRLPFRAVDVASEASSLRQPNTSGIYWTRLPVEESELRFGALALSIGRIDDEGRVFVNGQPAGESHDWRASPRFDLGGRLHAGDNDVVVIVRNGDGRGGLGRGVTLSGCAEAPAPHRRLFNGLAQVIIRPQPGGSGLTLHAAAEGLAPATIELPPGPSPH
jgi:beta-galactosidase